MSSGYKDIQELLSVLQTQRRNYQQPIYHFFRREYSFICYGWQAISIAEEYYKTKQVLRSEYGLDCVDISRKFMRSIASSLIDKHCKLVIWHKENHSATAMWQVQMEASSGSFDILEEELGNLEMEASSSCFSACVTAFDGDPLMGIALISVLTRRIALYKLLDDHQYSRLRSLLLRFNVGTVLIPVNSDVVDMSYDIPNSTLEDKLSQMSALHLSTIKIIKILSKFDIRVEVVPMDNLKTTEHRRRKILSQFNALHLKTDIESSPLNAIDNLRIEIADCDLGLAIDAAGVLISYFELMSNSIYESSFRIECGIFEDILLYNQNVLDILQVFPFRHGMECESTSNSNLKSKLPSSLFEILNFTKSKMGERLLRHWLQHPLRDKSTIEQRQAYIHGFMTNIESLHLLRESLDCLGKFPDLERIALKLRSTKVVENAHFTLKYMMELYNCTLKANKIGEILKTVESKGEGANGYPYGEMLIKKCKVFSTLQLFTEGLLDIDHMERLSHKHTKVNLYGVLNSPNSIKPLVLNIDKYYRVKPTFSQKLSELYSSLQSIEDAIFDCYGNLLKKVGCVSKYLHLEDSSTHGWHFRVTKRNSLKTLSALDAQNIIYEVLSQQKSGTLFISTEMKFLVQKFSDLREEYQKEQVSIVQQALQVYQSYTAPALEIAGVIGEVDVLASLAHNALESEWTRPVMHCQCDYPLGNKYLYISDLRHPILERNIGSLAIVPNDVQVSENDGYAMIITGPNMGGKSTYLKSIGLAVLLAQIGSFIPASAATMPIYDKLFIRSGSNDLSIIGCSTFMAEMLDTADIVGHASSKSLVLFDELGRGTSTSDGFGIAWAVLEELALWNKATIFFATHFHELNLLVNGPNPTDFVIFKSLFADAHVDKENHRVTMLYKIRDGSCGQSYGIHVAEAANLPNEIITNALKIELALNSSYTKSNMKRLIDWFEEDESQQQRKAIRNSAENVGDIPDNGHGGTC